jgi:two-component system sensor histidine kinase DegS
MADKIGNIEERIYRSLQDSLNELYLLRHEESERLNDIKERSAGIVMELRDLAAAIDQANRDYDLSRTELFDRAKRGETDYEKSSYERASEFMKIRGSLEERYRLLSAQKSELTQEEQRLVRLIAKSENMGNRLRMVLNLISMPENFTVEDEIQSTDAMMTAFMLAEREALTFARELHDGPTQTFSAVGLILEMGQEYMKRLEYEMADNEMNRALEQVRNGLNEMRAFLFSLNPTGIEGGFDVPLKRLAQQLNQMWGCNLSFALNGDVNEVSANVRIAAFKTLHQAVFNAARNGATDIKTIITYSKNMLRVHVTDNGSGFDVEHEKSAAKERGSYGLANMEERVKMLGGKITISSVIKKGSNVSFSIPILAGA